MGPTVLIDCSSYPQADLGVSMNWPSLLVFRMLAERPVTLGELGGLARGDIVRGNAFFVVLVTTDLGSLEIKICSICEFKSGEGVETLHAFKKDLSC